MASRFPAAIMMNLQGTGSVLTMAPLDLSLCPVIGNSPSWSAVRRFCWEWGVRVLISSMKRTPLWERWMAPASTRSWLGVSSPPLWNGSCLTSPRSAPAWDPVASMKGATVVVSFETRSFGTIDSSRGVAYRRAMKINAAAMTPMSHW
ncbi:MAG: hypothetical protein A4E42_00662 [Methanoregulaceae archaeon PtaU1.Bin222]|nr:MAG: hypothetical protein A4E42_00662 [Methanoregulaceae archaeon PtaU1.Bin222]